MGLSTHPFGVSRKTEMHPYGKYSLDKQILFWYICSMTTIRWTTSQTSVHNLGFHIIFCPKYRRPVLRGEIRERLIVLLNEKAGELGVKIEPAEVMPNHVHLFVKTTPVLAPHFVIGQLKGYTARRLRSEFSSLVSRLPSLWTRSYYIESVGHISEDTVKKYIEDQRGK